MTALNLWLDSYDDIYSDFDSRHYQKRRVSEDFLHELRTEMKYRQHQSATSLVLLLPQERRDETAEQAISQSLSDFFSSQFSFHGDKCRKKLNKGIFFLAAGMIVILLNSWISFYSAETFPAVALKVLLEPAGWFLLWAALDFLLYDFAGLKKEKDLYKKLSNMHICFKSS